MGLTYASDTLLCNFLFRTSITATRPTALYLGLLAPSTPQTLTAATTMTTIATYEEDDVGYARLQISASGGSPEYFGAPSNGVIANNTALDFSYTNAATYAVTHAFICDGATKGTSTGNLYAWSLLGASKTPGAGDKLEFAIGALTFTLA